MLVTTYESVYMYIYRNFHFNKDIRIIQYFYLPNPLHSIRDRVRVKVLGIRLYQTKIRVE